MVDIAIFGVTQRSGSTLLQRLFNANRNTVIWGENGRALEWLAGAHANAMRFSEFHAAERTRFFSEDRPIDLNISCMSPDLPIVQRASLGAVRALFEGLYPRGSFKRIGFKEVELGAAAVTLFRDAFPAATTIFLARHPAATWNSFDSAWARDPRDFINRWIANIEAYSRLGPILWYERLLSDRRTQDELCELAEITRRQFDAVLNAKVASTAGSFPKPERDFSVIASRCDAFIPSDIAAHKRPPRLGAI